MAGAQAEDAEAGSSEAGASGASAAVVRVTRLHEPATCSGRLIRHELPHTTQRNRPRQPFDSNGAFENRAAGAGVDATGWSWSAQFGDLDNDGDLDMYTVNGMIGEAFGHLPGAELVEENQALRNDGAGVFVPAPDWGLGATESGRGMALADLDLDLDGDLDIVVNNFQAPALLFENQVCGGASLQVDLGWPGSANPFAVGARLRLTTDKAPYWRETRVSSGYRSSDPPRAHFGLPRNERPLTLHVV